MRFIDLAGTGQNKFRHYLAGLLLVIAGWQVIGSIPLAATAMYFVSKGDYTNIMERMMRGEVIHPNLFLVLMISGFALGLLFLYLAVTRIHKRKFISVVTARNKFDTGRFVFAFTLWTLTGLLLFAVEYFLDPGNFRFQFDPAPFFSLLVISLLLLPVQTGFEEIFFRGYLLQGLKRTTHSTTIALIISSVIFGLMHGLNPEVAELGYGALIYYIGTGLFFAVIAHLDDGLELPMGFHAANNIFAAVWVTTDWSVFRTPALFLDISEPDTTWLIYLPVFVIYPLVFFIVKRKYRF